MLEVTENRQGTITHLWILIDNKIEIKESQNHEHYHVHFWEGAWDIGERGYFCNETSTVTCHTAIEKSVINKIERKLDKEGLVAIYYKGRVKELQSVE